MLPLLKNLGFIINNQSSKVPEKIHYARINYVESIV